MTRMTDTASNQTFDRELLSLNEIISERRSLYRQLCGNRVTLLTQFQFDLHPLYLPAIHVEKLLLNLLTDARYSMPFGGTILLATSNVATSNIDWPSTDGLPKDRYVRLLVEATRNPPNGDVLVRFPDYWDKKFSSKVVRAIVSANSGRVSACQQSEVVSSTEVILPAGVSEFHASEENRSTALPT
jgi:hypothetical protein